MGRFAAAGVLSAWGLRRGRVTLAVSTAGRAAKTAARHGPASLLSRRWPRVRPLARRKRFMRTPADVASAVKKD